MKAGPEDIIAGDLGLRNLRTICGTCNADSEEHTCQKDIAKLRAILTRSAVWDMLYPMEQLIVREVLLEGKR